MNGKKSDETLLLGSLLKENAQVFICPIIIQEVLQGINEDREYEYLKEWLLSLDIINHDHLNSSLASAGLYRRLRKKGITPRNSNDCMIAWYAIEYDLTLIHQDADFNNIAKHTPLKTYSAA